MGKLVESIRSIIEKLPRRDNVPKDPHQLCNRMREIVIELLGPTNGDPLNVRTTGPTWHGSLRVEIARLEEEDATYYSIGYARSPRRFILREQGVGEIRACHIEDHFPDMKNGSFEREATKSDRWFAWTDLKIAQNFFETKV